jgi:hypothetical protein
MDCNPKAKSRTVDVLSPPISSRTEDGHSVRSHALRAPSFDRSLSRWLRRTLWQPSIPQRLLPSGLAPGRPAFEAQRTFARLPSDGLTHAKVLSTVRTAARVPREHLNAHFHGRRSLIPKDHKRAPASLIVPSGERKIASCILFSLLDLCSVSTSVEEIEGEDWNRPKGGPIEGSPEVSDTPHNQSLHSG